MVQDTAAPPVWEFVRILRAGDQGCHAATPPGVAMLVLEHSPVNLLHRQLLTELTAATAHLAGDQSIRAVILTGSGDGPFSHGADLGELAAMDVLDATAHALTGQEAAAALAALPVPVIAAIGGACLAEGLELALACDLRVAAADAVLGLPQVQDGVSPGWGATQRLVRLIGLARTKELIFTGAKVGAERALTLGLVDRVAGPEGHLSAALALAGTIAKGAPWALGAAKEAIDQGCELTLKQGLRLEAALFGGLFAGTADGEGLTAWLTKNNRTRRGE